MKEIPSLADVSNELTIATSTGAFGSVRGRLDELGVDDCSLGKLLRRVSDPPHGQNEFVRLRERVQHGRPDIKPGALERYALLRVALSAVDGISTLRVPAEVKRLLLDEFLWLTRPGDRELAWLEAPTYTFGALCKLVTFRRFPAGQLHWEISGLQRSTSLRVRWRDLPRLAHAIIELGGFQPAFIPHLAWRARQIVLSEREHCRSLHLMAQAMELQPEVLGFVGAAWFYSPDTLRVSPHLAWASRLFETSGGTVVTTGRATASSGVFERSRIRQEHAAAGTFRPTIGLVIWPRSAMQRWAVGPGAVHAALS